MVAHEIGREDVEQTDPKEKPRVAAAGGTSFIWFQATLPNECWQSDVTHWRLRDGTEVEIVNFMDDHSRLVVASRVLARATAPAVLQVFGDAGQRWDFPRRCSPTTAASTPPGTAGDPT